MSLKEEGGELYCSNCEAIHGQGSGRVGELKDKYNDVIGLRCYNCKREWRIT
jgi:hypothetical protein